MNVKEIIESLILKFPISKPLLSNVLSAEIKDQTLILNYPDFFKSYQESEILNSYIDEYLWYKNGIKLQYFFKSYTIPHLPHPAVSSKHNNKLFFLKLVDTNLIYTLIDKKKFYDFFSLEKKYHPFIIQKAKINNKILLFDFIEEILREILPELRTEYKYLHPIITINSFENFFYFDMLFENIFKFIVDNKKIMDVRRYVGVPCYSFIDYFNFFGVENDY